MFKRAAILSLLLGLALCLQVQAQEARYDILIVGNDSNPTLREMSREVRRGLEIFRAEMRLSSRELPVDEYDISKPSHLNAVKKLGINPKKAVYLAVCRLGGPKNLPNQVLVGVGPVTDVNDAIGQMILAVAKRLNVEPPPGLSRVPPPPPGTPPSSSRGVSIERAVICRQLDDGYQPVDPTSRFGTRDRLNVSVYSPNMRKGVVVTAKWYANGSNFGTTDYKSTINGPAYVGFWYTPGDQGWEPGSYRVDILMGGRVLKSAPFTVGSGTSVPPPVSTGDLGIDAVVICKSVDDDYKPVNPTTRFNTAETFFASVHAENLRQGAKVVAKWYADGELLRETTYNSTIDGPAYIYFSLKPKDQWDTGNYTLEIWGDGQFVRRERFRVTY